MPTAARQHPSCRVYAQRAPTELRTTPMGSLAAHPRPRGPTESVPVVVNGVDVGASRAPSSSSQWEAHTAHSKPVCGVSSGSAILAGATLTVAAGTPGGSVDAE